LHSHTDLNVGLEALDDVELLFECHTRDLDDKVVKRLGVIVDAPPLT
jgi:hypothetical protein